MNTGARLLIGLALSLVIGGAGYVRGALSAGGWAGAILLGTPVLAFGGWVWAGALVAFFGSSTLLSSYRKPQKALAIAKAAKGSRRDFGQVIANGGVAGLLALLVGVFGKDSTVYPMLALAFFGTLAAANADTWATELGVLSPRRPRLIVTGRPVPPGTSGGVTPEGTLAALAGAAFMGAVAFGLIQGAALLTQGRWLLQDWILIPVATISGLAGAFLDSLLGATVQTVYRCPLCRIETERAVHHCGSVTVPLRGWHWMDNDVVNFLATLAGAIVAALAAVVLL
jgi:uncharacterized protein (TIGR00297 family)